VILIPPATQEWIDENDTVEAACFIVEMRIASSASQDMLAHLDLDDGTLPLPVIAAARRIGRIVSTYTAADFAMHQRTCRECWPDVASMAF